MTLKTGTVAHWRNFSPGHDKFIYILGTNADGDVLSFTISSQAKYLAMHPHAEEMVEIPNGTVECLNRRSFIQCFYDVTRTPVAAFREMERIGQLNYRASLPQYAAAIAAVVQNSELLDGYDQEAVLEVLAQPPQAQAAIT
jgi:hypothetical protein